MGREFRVISALNPVGFRLKTYALCDDTEVIGAQFYIMEFVEGIIAIDANDVAKRFNEAQRHAIGCEVVDVLVRLHSYDPNEIGLGDFGKPSGYLDRQVKRFADQLATYATAIRPNSTAWPFASTIPPERKAGIVHGDYGSTTPSSTSRARSVPSSTGRCALAIPRRLGLLRMWGRPHQRADLLGSGTVMTLPASRRGKAAAAREGGVSLANLDFYRPRPLQARRHPREHASASSAAVPSARASR
jgi:hypothetical protein